MKAAYHRPEKHPFEFEYVMHSEYLNTCKGNLLQWGFISIKVSHFNMALFALIVW